MAVQNVQYYRQVHDLDESGVPKIKAFRPRPLDNYNLSVDCSSAWLSPPPSFAKQIFDWHSNKINGGFHTTRGSWRINTEKCKDLEITPDKSQNARPGHCFITFPKDEDRVNLLAMRLRDTAVKEYPV